MPIPDALQQAAGFLKAGQSQAACSVLVEYLKQHPKSEAGWLMLSHALPDQNLQKDCVRRVLQINPENTWAQARWRELSAAPADVSEKAGPTAPPASPLADEAPAVPPFTAGSIMPEELAEEAGFFLSPEAGPEAAQPAWWGSQEAIPPPSFPYRPGDEADRVPAASPEPVPDKKTHSQTPSLRPKRKQTPPIWVLVLVLPVVLCLLGGAALWIATDYLSLQAPFAAGPQAPTASPRSVSQAGSPGSGFPTLPPTWTATPTPTITPTPPPSATPTLPPPYPTAAAQMTRIEQEVSDLRGLTIQNQVPQYLVNRKQAQVLLSDMLLTDDYRRQLEDQARVLSALGLIKPTYDLVNYALNGLVDNLGGVYVPWKKEIYVLGVRFGGLEHYVYAHEFNHALIDQHFDIAGKGVYPECLMESDRCAAIQALVEGDATLMANQWLQQYATPQDYRDFLAYVPPAQALPEQFPPPFVLEDLNFPYVYGAAFVEDLYQQGRWTAVNQVYANLPASSEQILHPEKYRSGELPLIVEDPPLDVALGPGWRQLESDVLGEWMTYLMLQYGADLQAQVGEEAAWKAANGWGGDHYQVYGSDETDQTVVAAHWVWDSPIDASQFDQAMTQHLHERFRGARLDRSGTPCWEVNGQTTCLFTKDRLTLWLLAPDQATLDSVLALYPDFR